MYAIGLDVGNTFTKHNGSKKLFPSKIKNEYDTLNEDTMIKVEYNNNTFSIGVGTEITTRKRYFSDYYKILTLTGIAETIEDSDNIDCILVIGLPINYFKDVELRKSIEKEILSWKNETIKINDIVKKISIEKVSLWIEGGIVLLDENKYANEKILVVDIGGYTIDSIEFNNNKLGNNKTLKTKGILKVKDEILEAFNLDNHSNITNVDEILKNIKKDLPYTIHGKSVDLKKYRNMLSLYASKIFNELNISYELEDKTLVFTGGGSIDIFDEIKQFDKEYKIDIVNDQNINQKTYSQIAKTLLNVGKNDSNE